MEIIKCLKPIRVCYALCFLLVSSLAAQSEEWITILVHGLVGLQANLSLNTIMQAKNDSIEGTPYERSVSAVREHPYLFALQPMQKLGLHPICQRKLNASYAFGVLYKEVQKMCDIHEKNTFYTFGWSALVSEKRRYCDANKLYRAIKRKIELGKKKNIHYKIRLIVYSHGATMALTMADVHKEECNADSFGIDELFLIGMPVDRIAHKRIESPLFKRVYNIYSRGDKIQRLDIFTPCDVFTHRVFKGCLPSKLTQIELRLTGKYQRNPCYCLPPHMRGITNQSPGHIELWFFGWTPSSYRKNLNMYPLPASVFLPFIVCTAQKTSCRHITLDIRPEQEIALIREPYSFMPATSCMTVPFLNRQDYQKLINKGHEFDPLHDSSRDEFLRLQSTIDKNAYK